MYRPPCFDCGASIVLLGHSERRADHGETSELVAAKAAQAFETGLSAMICVGETLAQRDSGDALATVLDQLKISVPDATNDSTDDRL